MSCNSNLTGNDFKRKAAEANGAKSWKEYLVLVLSGLVLAGMGYASVTCKGQEIFHQKKGNLEFIYEEGRFSWNSNDNWRENRLTIKDNSKDSFGSTVLIDSDFERNLNLETGPEIDNLEKMVVYEKGKKIVYDFKELREQPEKKHLAYNLQEVGDSIYFLSRVEIWKILLAERELKQKLR